MTNGTSQGLYVIIAVVIFGIFIGISYLLFQDSLNPKLTSIFDTSLYNAENELLSAKDLLPHTAIPLNNENFEKTATGYKVFYPSYEIDINTSFKKRDFLNIGNGRKKIIKYGEKITFSFDIVTNQRLGLNIDYNTGFIGVSQSSNDFYSNQINEEGSGTNYIKTLEPNKRYTIVAGYSNLNKSANPEMKDLDDFSVMYLLGNPISKYTDLRIELSNMRYTISKH